MRPDDRKYAESHEWVKPDGDTMLIGITDFAVQELSNGNDSDLVYCDLPEPGRVLAAGDTFGEIESVKAVSDLYSPVTGEVIETNESLVDNLEILNDDTYGAGWMLKIKFTAVSDDLIDLAAYEEVLKNADD